MKLWKSSVVSPKLCEPDANDSVTYKTEDETMNCLAVKLPPTLKSPLTTPLPVIFIVLPSNDMLDSTVALGVE